MSENPAGDEVHEETAPIEPPITLGLFDRLKPLVVPAILLVLIACVVIFGVIPILNAWSTADMNLEKVRQESVRSYSRK